MGCIPRYAAKEIANMNVMLAPWEALAMAVRMNMLVMAEVERARHVRTVKGLKRKLWRWSADSPYKMKNAVPCCNGCAAPT